MLLDEDGRVRALLRATLCCNVPRAVCESLCRHLLLRCGVCGFCVAGAHFAGVGIWTQRKRSARAGRHDRAHLARTAALAHTRRASRGWLGPHDAAGLRVAWLRHCPFCVRAGVFQEQTNSHYLSGRPNTTHSNGSLARARSPRLHRSSLLTPRDTLFEQFSRAPSKHVYMPWTHLPSQPRTRAVHTRLQHTSTFHSGKRVQ